MRDNRWDNRVNASTRPDRSRAEHVQHVDHSRPEHDHNDDRKGQNTNANSIFAGTFWANSSARCRRRIRICVVCSSNTLTTETPGVHENAQRPQWSAVPRPGSRQHRAGCDAAITVHSRSSLSVRFATRCEASDTSTDDGGVWRRAGRWERLTGGPATLAARGWRARRSVRSAGRGRSRAQPCSPDDADCPP